MERSSIQVSRYWMDRMKKIKEEMGLTSTEDVVSFLVDLYAGIPERVPKDAFLELRDKYILDFPQEFFETSLETKGIMDASLYRRKFEDTITEKISERADVSPEGTIFECHNCGHVWRYSGMTGLMHTPIAVLCPSCKYRVSRNDIRVLSPAQPLHSRKAKAINQ